MDDNFNEEIRSAIEAGKSNLRAKALLNNWCTHAEVSRSSGRGMIEASTGLPIGHSGVQCKFSKANSSYSWLLEDEPPRDCRRVTFLREYSDDKIKLYP